MLKIFIHGACRFLELLLIFVRLKAFLQRLRPNSMCCAFEYD